MPTRYASTIVILSLLACGSHPALMAAADHKALAAQTQTCPCVTCTQRWSVQRWLSPEHPYTSAERNVALALLTCQLAQVQQKDPHSDNVTLPLIDLILDYSPGQEWLEMPAYRGWLLPNNKPNYIQGHLKLSDRYSHNRYSIGAEMPLVTEDVKFAEADIKAIDAVLRHQQDNAEAMSLCKRYKVAASFNYGDSFDQLIRRWYALPHTKQRLVTLMQQQQYQVAHPWLSYISSFGHKG